MLKLIKPVTSSLRHLKRITHNSLNKKVLIKKRLKLKKKSVGKNNVGGIVVYHKGGGHKQRFREIDFKRKHLFGIVCSIEYDPFRTSYIASVFDFNVEQHFYILSPKNLLVGDIINSGDNVKPKLGNLLKFRDLPLGSIIHNVELNRNSGAKLIRSAGCFGQLIQKYKKHARIKLCSGKIILILLNCYAVVGRLSNETHHMGCVGKAGRNRWLNKRPTVRGVAMNPVDHPNGGGEGKKSGKKNSISPWGKLSKGTSTKKKYIYIHITYKMAFRSRQIKNHLLALAQSHAVSYPSPINLNYAWSFGFLAGVALAIQILTGVILAMHYVPNIDYAFNSVEHIMRNINYGWFFRYAHANGASMFFIVTYCHIFRGLYYGSYIHPRQLLWCSGVLIMLLMMGTAFIGYVLPWGQMSFWGATVITSMLTVIPVAGKAALEWFWGGFTVGNATLNRMFSLHFLLPFIIAGVVIVHLILLHKVGSNNPLGVDDVDVILFYPYFFVKDLYALYIFLFLFAIIVFFYPNTLGHPDNYIPADPYKTPTHIVPEWYFLPFYAMLRSIPHKAGGIAAMLGSILVWFIIPFINTSEVRNTEYRPIYKFFFAILIIDFIFLGWLGQRGVYECHINFGQNGTFYYFFFFFVLSPVIGLLEKRLVRIKIEQN